MHYLTGKPEERLYFDIQPEIAKSLGYQARPGLSAVERFMKHYFLVAKDVGDLTRIFSAALEDQQAKAAPGIGGMIGRFANRPRKIPGASEFIDDRGRIALADIPVTSGGTTATISIWSRNLFNEAHIYRRSNANRVPIDGNYRAVVGDYANFNTPRTFGIEAILSF